MDLSIYDIPKEGEKIVFTKDYCEKEYSKRKYTLPLNISIKKGTEFSICSQHPHIQRYLTQIQRYYRLQKPGTKGLVLRIIDNDSNYYNFFYLDIKDYFKTKSQLRNDKLKKILS